MARQLTAADAKQSLTAHVAAKGVEIFAKYGPQLGWAGLQRLLEDRAYVRYPCTVAFDAGPLGEGEFAHPVQQGDVPEAGFTMYVHPVYEGDRDRAVALILYQLVVVNYGEFAAADDAESFGAAALGMTCDEYYALLCELAERVGVVAVAGTLDEPGGCGGGCSCG